jgi:predicted nuclease of restriction endonuclease-like RecB superfamily
MSYSETKSLPKRKAELEAEYQSMSLEIRQQVIPRTEASRERAELRTIAKEIVRDFRKAVAQRRRDLRETVKDLSEIRKWYRKSFGGQ